MMQPNHPNIIFSNIAANWKANPRISVVSIEHLRTLLIPLSEQEPGFVELESATSNLLQLGIGGRFACAQLTTCDDKPQYLSAQPRIVRATTDVEFLCGGTLTPIPPELCLSFQEAVKISEYFFETGNPDPDFEWVHV